MRKEKKYASARVTLNHSHHFSQIFNFERWENSIQFQTVMLIKTEFFGSKSNFQRKALNLGGWRFDQLFSSAKQFFPVLYVQDNVIKFQVIWGNHYISSSDQGNRTTPTRRCIKATQSFASQGSYICCKKVNFVFQQITSNLFQHVTSNCYLKSYGQITIHIRKISLAVSASPVLFI